MEKQFFILPHIKVNGANALNSLYTVGFPAMTAFLGFGHALQRKVEHLNVLGVGVAVHQAEFQAVTDNYGRSWSLKTKKFPIVRARKQHYPGEFTSDSFQARAYVHLDVSILLKCGDIQEDLRADVLESIKETLPTLRLAGGTITSFDPRSLKFCGDTSNLFWKDHQAMCHSALRAMMPGFALVERKDIMEELGKTGNGDALDRLFYATSSDAIPVKTDKDNVTYHWQRHIKGWLVPLAVGFHDLSGSLTVEGQRSYDAEHHFVEPLISLCEFRMPHHFDSIEDILWHYEYDGAQRNYLCVNDNHIAKE